MGGFVDLVYCLCDGWVIHGVLICRAIWLFTVWCLGCVAGFPLGLIDLGLSVIECCGCFLFTLTSLFGLYYYFDLDFGLGDLGFAVFIWDAFRLFLVLLAGFVGLRFGLFVVFMESLLCIIFSFVLLLL